MNRSLPSSAKRLAEWSLRSCFFGLMLAITPMKLSKKVTKAAGVLIGKAEQKQGFSRNLQESRCSVAQTPPPRPDRPRSNAHHHGDHSMARAGGAVTHCRGTWNEAVKPWASVWRTMRKSWFAHKVAAAAVDALRRLRVCCRAGVPILFPAPTYTRSTTNTQPPRGFSAATATDKARHDALAPSGASKLLTRLPSATPSKMLRNQRLRPSKPAGGDIVAAELLLRCQPGSRLQHPVSRVMSSCDGSRVVGLCLARILENKKGRTTRTAALSTHLPYLLCRYPGSLLVGWWSVQKEQEESRNGQTRRRIPWLFVVPAFSPLASGPGSQVKGTREGRGIGSTRALDLQTY